MSVQSITVFRAEGPKNYKEQESLLGTQPSGYNRLRVLYVRCFGHLYLSQKQDTLYCTPLWQSRYLCGNSDYFWDSVMRWKIRWVASVSFKRSEPVFDYYYIQNYSYVQYNTYFECKTFFGRIQNQHQQHQQQKFQKNEQLVNLNTYCSETIIYFIMLKCQ